MSTFKKSMVGVAIVAAAFSAGAFLGPKRVETREVEKIVYRDRVIREDKKQIRVETKETKLPDGTTIKETIRDRKSETHVDSQKNVVSERMSEKTVVNPSQWGVGVYTSIGYNPARIGYPYMFTVDKRILGGLSVGAFGRTDAQFGVGLRLEF